MNALNAQIVSFVATDGPCTARQVLQRFPELEDTAATLRTLKVLVAERMLEERTAEAGNLAFAIAEARNDSPVAEDPTPTSPLARIAPGKKGTAAAAAVVAERIREATLAFLANQDAGANVTDMRQLFERQGVPSSLGYKCLEPLIRDGRIVSTGNARSLHLRLSTVDAGAPSRAAPVATKKQAEDFHDVDRQLDQAERDLSDKLLRAALASSDMSIRKIAFAIESIRSARAPLRPGAKPRAKGARTSPARKPRKPSRAARKKTSKRSPRKR